MAFNVKCYLPKVYGEKMYQLNEKQYLYEIGTWVPENVVAMLISNGSMTELPEPKEMSFLEKALYNGIVSAKKDVDEQTAEQHYILKGKLLGLTDQCDDRKDISNINNGKDEMPSDGFTIASVNPVWYAAGALLLIVLLTQKKRK